MFKLESYITPVILSYVEKYVKNFKPEQSQLSLWGGDASFQSLDLRLEVLEDQLNLPFTFVSGHIHELLIHVPWVKITSEPIVVTINTIECILNLKQQGQAENSTTINRGSGQKSIQEEAPPGYIKSIVTKVINNITINCNNLILKLVEEDIVLSVNVRFLSMQTVNNQWEPAFTDVSSYEVTVRKIVTVDDMTLCLDKMDTAGKIEIYQDPVLYRCSMMIRLMMNYHSNLAHYATLTRFDLHCEKMEFSMTEQQLPMLLRLIAMITDLQAKRLVIRKDKATAAPEERGEIVQDDDDQGHGALPEAPTWGGWAWNTVTSFLPVDWDTDWDNEEQTVSTGYMLHFGVYIDDAALTFKTVESLPEQLFYKSRKIRYNSFLTLRVTGAVMSMLVKGISMSNVSFGLGSIRLHPRGPCSCGYQEVVDGVQPPLYIKAGTIGNDYLKNSLFDKNAIEDTDLRNYYREYDIDRHLATVDVTSLREKCPAFGMDITRCIEIPEDIPLEKLAEFGSNFEYSNFPERKVTRYVVGDVQIRLCSGLMHRIDAFKRAAKYDSNPETVKKPEPNVDELPPVTVEEYEALRENVPVVETHYNARKISVQFQLSDHGIGKLPNSRPCIKNSAAAMEPAFSDDPHLSIEAEEIVATIVAPMYAFRLASCASRQAEIDSEMLDDCFSVVNIKLSGIQSQLYLAKDCRILIVMPCVAKCNKKSLIYPQYWRSKNLIQDTMDCDIDAITFTGTKPKLMVAMAIATSIADPTDDSNPLFCSSLFNDACNEKDSVYLELSLENIRCKRMKSSSTVCVKINVESMKTFAINDTQQAFILSGPEINSTRESANAMLLTVVLQYPETVLELNEAPILSFRVSETRCSIDPLLRKWLQYEIARNKPIGNRPARAEAEQPIVEDTPADVGTRKKKFRTLHDSVHSSSDKEKKKSGSRTEWSKGVSGGEEVQKTVPTKDEAGDVQKFNIISKITELYPLWRKIVLCGYFGHLVVYMPTTTMDGIGVAGIELAKDRALNGDPDLFIFAMKSPTILINSVNVQFEQLSRHLECSSSHMPTAIWTQDYHSFPWTFSLDNFHCYTLKKDVRRNFIDKVDLTATIDIATKHGVSDITDFSLAGLGLCVYVNTSPVIISISEDQVPSLRAVASDMTKLIDLVRTPDAKTPAPTQTELEELFSDIPKSPSSYTRVLYAENTSTQSTLSTAKDEQEKETERVVITAMIQWTIMKIAVKLYVTDPTTAISTKLVLELEDIITTFDWQPIYLKLKNKITTATVCHYRRMPQDRHWELGDYAGLIMCGRESSPEQIEDTGFFSVTMTTAQSGNVHTRWGAQRQQKSQKAYAKKDRPLLTESHITEIDINLQMVDVILPLGTINKFAILVKPLMQSDQDRREYRASDDTSVEPSTIGGEKLEKTSLPLIYLEFKGMNLMVPTSGNVCHGLQHDLLILQLDGISITPNAENPICRTILRSDIYQLAAQSNILNIPGSMLEDRQYQVNIKGISSCTTTWKNYQRNVTKRMSQSYLYTMNENPALEWNNLRSDGNVEPQFSTCPLMSRFDVRLIIAPAVVLNPSNVVCGSAFEVTCLTDIEVSINFDQIKLISTMYSETITVLSGYWEKVETNFETETNDRDSSSLRPILGIVATKEYEPDYAADSGVDFESSSVNVMLTKKLPGHETSTHLPSEILINCGTITISLYSIAEAQTLLEAQSGKDELGEDDDTSSKSLILHVMLNEPNVYISDLYGTNKIQISCFDFGVLLDNIVKPETPLVVNERGSKSWLIESKNGDPHPVSGIPPSFVVMKLETSLNPSSQLSIDMGRPTQINLSIPALKHIEYVKNEIASCFANDIASEFRQSKPPQAVATASRKGRSFECPDVNFTSKQMVISLTTSYCSKILVSVSSSFGNTSRTTKPERIFGNLSLNSLVISADDSGGIQSLLNPCCCHVTTYLLWETWQDEDADPQVQVQAECESLRFEFGPRQMKIIQAVKDDYYSLVDYFRPNSSLQQDVNVVTTTTTTATTEQHYKDDLKAGAFQFVDGHSDELPLPYQVVFYTSPAKAMAWRYPQPRVITGLQVAPIPFAISEDVDFVDDPVSCVLEYWSDSHMAYQRYGEFHLAETESYRPELPSTPPAQAVASVWRVLLSFAKSPRHDALISPHVLAACLRIDSYFNASIVPNLQVAWNIGAIHVSFLNNLNYSADTKLPHPLTNFHLRSLIPQEQCFARLEQRGTSIIYNRWSSGSSLIDLSGILNLKVLDYSFLRMQSLLDNFETKIQISLSDVTNVSMEYNPFTIKIGPSIAHTLAVSTNLWVSTSNDNYDDNVVVLTRVVVANDSNVEIRFGQVGSADNISLNSRQCHFYSWRHTGNRTMRIAIESNGWTWSNSFSVKQNGKQLVTFGNSSTGSPVICAKVISLSATQKLVTFSGLLVLTNQLTQSFEMKLVKYSPEAGSKPIVANESHDVGGNGRCPSIVLDSNTNMAMRLRFATSANFSWTGDIPLKPNSKWGQPWLVKVPLQERGQFWSIWARIVTENVHGMTKVLAILSPLYMIKSYLPVPVTVQIETPSLKTSMSATINGRGERQQLCCPGTFEHSHQLTFQFETGISASNPHVPLSYNSVEQRKFFKRPENEDIDAILSELENHVEIVHWPFQTDDTNVWIPTEQPHTHVQVKYQDAGLVSSTLLLELQPWCFILNTLGCQISLVADDIELCQVPHRGVITPPKLEGTFNLRVDIDGVWYSSPALHLASADWSQGFYMPKIRGLIPVEGNVKTSINCGSNICIVSINSKMQEDMRVVRVTTSHVLCNSTGHEFHVAGLAVDEARSGYEIPEDLSFVSFSIPSSDDRTRGVPVAQWCTVDTENTMENVALYICLSRGYGWSCPVRVDRTVARRCISISDDVGAIPVVVTVQEEKGTTYISIHPDDHPQLYIENGCPFGILVGEANVVADGICPESRNFSWICEVDSGTASYYSTPSVGNRLPDGQTMEQLPKLVLSSVPIDRNKDGPTDKRNVLWSGPIITSQVASGRVEQYVRLPVHGDIKLSMVKRCHTIRLHVVCMSQVDISARDIRTRLILKETGSRDNAPEELQSLTSSSTSVSFTRECDADDRRNKNQESIGQSESADITTTSKLRIGSLTVYIRGINVILMQDLNERGQRIEVASLCLSDLIVMTISNPQSLTIRAFVGDIQLDNQMFVYGGFDFPVVLINQHPYVVKGHRFSMKSHSKNFIDEIEGESLIVVDCDWEVDELIYACKNVRIRIGPINTFIEDTFVSQLLEYTSSIVPPCLGSTISRSKTKETEVMDNCVSIPEYIVIDCTNLRSPLRIQKFTIEPISLLLSVHTSIRLYVALDHSPLYFGAFERERLQTTPYRLGNALTMHYLSGAIFGAGWVVGSLEILGSPGGFAQALGYGLRDFIALPIRGLLNGPWGFLIGITHGSASLMKHFTAGTVNSVTKLASSVARNLDRLTLDEEHLQRQEESRRTRPQGMAQGLYQGLTGFGMSVLAAVAGLAHHPLQQVLSGEATTRGLVTGVGLGIVGAVTKPLSGAAELVALTGQGLLEGTGWNPLPVPRQKPVFECMENAGDLSTQYAWRLLPMLTENVDSILHVANVDFRSSEEAKRPVTLILTRESLLLVDAVEDTVEKIYSLKDLTYAEHPSDPTVFCLHCLTSESQPIRSSSPIEYPEMDEAMRARVEQFVRGSSTGCASLSATSYVQSEKIEIPSSHPENTLTFYVRPDDRNYLLSLFEVAKRQGQGNDFPVL